MQLRGRPAGAKLVLSLETVDGGGTALSWWLTDQLPGCVPPSVTTSDRVGRPIRAAVQHPVTRQPNGANGNAATYRPSHGGSF